MYLVTDPPTDEPISLAEAKAFLRVDHDDEDDMIEGMISAARVYSEHYCNRAFLTQTVKEQFSPAEEVILTLAPVGSVVSVTVDGDTLVEQTDYQVIDRLAYVAIRFTPAPAASPIVEYTAGDTAAASVNPTVKLAIKHLVADMYENRVNAVRNLPTAAANLLNTQRRWLT